MAIPYPRGELDQKGALLNKLGSFWQYQFEDSGLLEGLYRAACDDYEQQQQNIVDAGAVLSRQSVPVYRRQWWRLLRIRQSQLGAVDTAKITYGQAGLTYGDGSRYGQLKLSDLFLYPLAGSLGQVVGISAIMNRLEAPTATWLSDIDYQVSPGVVAFRVDPFADDRFAFRIIYDDAGNPIDKEAALWAYAVDIDAKFVWNHVGYVVGRNYPSSQAYKDYVNAIWDMHSWGPTDLGLRKLIAAAVGMPLVKGASEVVEKILTYEGVTIITDQNVYKYLAGAVPAIAVGDTVREGDSLIQDFAFVELRGNTPDLSGFEGLSLNTGMLRDPYLGSLYFINQDVPLEYMPADTDGVVDAKFPISGFPLDVIQFWDTVHARGKAAGATLAQLLDTRTSGNGEPRPENLPATINPLQIITQLIGANFMLVRVRSGLIPAGAPGIHGLGILRDVLPSRTSVIIYVEITVPAETYAYTDIVDDTISCQYGVTAPGDSLAVDDPDYAYVMVGSSFVLVDAHYVVVGSGQPAMAETYGHLIPTIRQIDTACA